MLMPFKIIETPMFFTARAVLEFLIVKSELGLGELDVFGGDFDCGG